MLAYLVCVCVGGKVFTWAALISPHKQTFTGMDNRKHHPLIKAFHSLNMRAAIAYE